MFVWLNYRAMVKRQKMKLNLRVGFAPAASLLVVLSCSLVVRGADAAKTDKPVIKPGLLGGDLFADEVVAKGKGLEVRRSQLDEAIMAFKANRAAAGQPVPEGMQPEVEAQMLDRLMGTPLFPAR